MKIIYSIFLFLMLLNDIYSQQDSYYINGIIDSSFNNKLIMLFSFKNDSIAKVDTSRVLNGKFYFTGEEYLEEVSLLSIGNYPDKVITTDVILEKGVIEVSLKHSRINGTPLNNLYQYYRDTTRENGQKIDKLFEEQQQGERVYQDSPIHKLFIEDGLFTVDFKKNNIDNIVGKYFFETEVSKRFGESYAYESHLDAFMEIYNSASEEYRNSQRIQELLNEIKTRNEKDFNLNFKRDSMEGKLYTDFEFITPRQDKTKLSNFVGKSKLLLLDFWASWCGPCIAEMPYLKELFAKYNTKGLDIIGISMDTSLKRWTDGLNTIETPWEHISDLKGTESEFANSYHVYGIPYAVLIDEKGYIIKMGKAGSMEKVIKDLLEIN